MKPKDVQTNLPYWIKMPVDECPERWVLTTAVNTTNIGPSRTVHSLKFHCLDVGAEEYYDLRKPLEIMPIPDADTLRRYYDVVASL